MARTMRLVLPAIVLAATCLVALGGDPDRYREEERERAWEWIATEGCEELRAEAAPTEMTGMTCAVREPFESRLLGKVAALACAWRDGRLVAKGYWIPREEDFEQIGTLCLVLGRFQGRGVVSSYIEPGDTLPSRVKFTMLWQMRWKHPGPDGEPLDVLLSGSPLRDWWGGCWPRVEKERKCLLLLVRPASEVHDWKWPRGDQ